jgi:GT2 family glycosyltransferase
MSSTNSASGLALRKPFSIRVQSVLYHTPIPAIERSLEYYDNAARIAQMAGVAREMIVAYGDCSPERILDAATLGEMRRRFEHLSNIEYTYFGANLGSAAGHNRLLEDADSDLLMTANPDILAAPTVFVEFDSALSRPGVGLVEARQLPVEHPKHYDPNTGETSWGSTACLIGSTDLFRRVNGFDAETFFLYCDDVDFCWRVRLTGLKVIHQPSAVVFHDKRLREDGGWMAGTAERYYSAESGLLLPYKYSRDDLTENVLKYFINSGDEHMLKAAKTFEWRKNTGKLPAQIDKDHTVGEFIDGGYARWRYKPH